jgi:hypothetical protein
MPDKCPECDDPWDKHLCGRCGLTYDDVEAAEDFYDSLLDNADSLVYDRLLDDLLNRQLQQKAPK